MRRLRNQMTKAKQTMLHGGVRGAAGPWKATDPADTIICAGTGEIEGTVEGEVPVRGVEAP